MQQGLDPSASLDDLRVPQSVFEGRTCLAAKLFQLLRRPLPNRVLIALQIADQFREACRIDRRHRLAGLGSELNW